MITPKTPVNREAGSLLSRRHRICETVEEALEGAINHLMSGKFHDQLIRVFQGEFGPEPWVTFQITVHKDPKDSGKFTYSSNTKVGHDIGPFVKMNGLKP